MAIAVSICIAVLITLAIFPKEFRKADLSPVIFILSLTLIGFLCSLNGVPSMQMSKGPNFLLIGGAGMLLVLTGTTTNTFKILTSIPASAYKSLVPAAICVGVLLVLGLTVIL